MQLTPPIVRHVRLALRSAREAFDSAHAGPLSYADGGRDELELLQPRLVELFEDTPLGGCFAARRVVALVQLAWRLSLTATRARWRPWIRRRFAADASTKLLEAEGALDVVERAVWEAA